MCPVETNQSTNQSATPSQIPSVSKVDHSLLLGAVAFTVAADIAFVPGIFERFHLPGQNWELHRKNGKTMAKTHGIMDGGFLGFDGIYHPVSSNMAGWKISEWRSYSENH